jgi:predicted O-methyltransferase YrrM
VTAEPAEIERAFAAAGPWQSRFVIDGHAYGGELRYQEDGRVAQFFDWVGAPASVLELGSLEGAHSVQLAAEPSVERLVCLDGREENVTRARHAMAVLGLSERVQVEQVDLEDADLAAFGTFDAAFCAGLLYHLSRPWLLLRELRRHVRVLFLDTHVSATGNIVFAGYPGSLYRELGLDDPFSGLQDFSFWPTAAALEDMLAEAGFAVVRRLLWPSWPNGPRVHLLCEASLPPARVAEAGPATAPIVAPARDVDVPSLDAPPAELDRFFERTGPWQTRVEIGGRGYGGPYPFGEGGRVERFLEWSGNPRRVLELGSLEGGCSVELAAAACVDELVCIEARTESVERARLLLRLYGVERKAELHVADLEEDDLAGYGRFDGIFCAGVLYHLTRPWELVARMAAITDHVFVDTHVSETDHILVAGYRGRLYAEFGYDDPMSGTAPCSFWPTEPELVRMFAEAGMRPTERIQAPPGPGPRVWLEFVRQRDEAP